MCSLNIISLHVAFNFIFRRPATRECGLSPRPTLYICARPHIPCGWVIPIIAAHIRTSPRPSRTACVQIVHPRGVVPKIARAREAVHIIERRPRTKNGLNNHELTLYIRDIFHNIDIYARAFDSITLQYYIYMYSLWRIASAQRRGTPFAPRRR